MQHIFTNTIKHSEISPRRYRFEKNNIMSVRKRGNWLFPHCTVVGIIIFYFRYIYFFLSPVKFFAAVVRSVCISAVSLQGLPSPSTPTSCSLQSSGRELIIALHYSDNIDDLYDVNKIKRLGGAYSGNILYRYYIVLGLLEISVKSIYI